MENEQRKEILKKWISDHSSEDSLDIIIPSFLSKRLISYQAIIADMSFLNDCIGQFLALYENKIAALSIWQTIIITYCKCFNSNNSGKSSLNTKDCFKEQHELEVLHNKLTDLRNEYVAHRGSPVFEFQFALMRKHEEDKTEIVVHQYIKNLPPIEDIQQLIPLFNHVSELTKEKFEKAAQWAKKSMLDEFTPEQLAFMVLPKKV